MKNRKKMIVTAAVFGILALLAGCTAASAVSPEGQQTVPPTGTILNLDEVKTIAYAHAGVPEDGAYDKSYDFEDGSYEIGFDYEGWEYDYHIAPDGTILGVTREPDADRKPAETKPAETRPAETEPAQTQPQRITAQEALAIALDHAGVTDAREKEAEWDDGRWEVSFESGRTEYDYDISAQGKILRREKETDD